jgi:hypothetical protein
MIDLSGQKAFVTGAAAGIGRATARTLAEAGAQVTASDVNVAGLDETIAQIKAAGGTAEARQLDVTDPAAIKVTAEAVTADHGAMDVLVNVAGWDKIMPFMENPPDFIDEDDTAPKRLSNGPILAAPNKIKTSWGDKNPQTEKKAPQEVKLTHQLGDSMGGLWGQPSPREESGPLRDMSQTKRRWTVTERSI